jgi:DNA replication protein DnaC
MSFEMPAIPVRLCSRCGAEGATNLPGTIASSEQLCPECVEDWKVEEAERKQQASDEREARRVREGLKDLSLRFPRMADWSFDTYPADARGRAAVKRAMSWIYPEDDSTVNAGYTNNLLIVGPVGSGKTGLAWSVMRHLFIDDYSTVDFVNVRQLLADIRRSFGDHDAPDPLAGLATVQILVLDDLGAERPTDWALETVATLIEDRYQRDLDAQTIVTSNYTPSQLADRLGRDDPVIGQRIVSRLVESCTQIRLEGADRRVNQKKAA